jgi:CHAT domain-containing protein/tetratricopeptide (TPR) repeat protein
VNAPPHRSVLATLALLVALPLAAAEPGAGGTLAAGDALSAAGIDPREVEAARRQVGAEEALRTGRFAEARAGFEEVVQLYTASQGPAGKGTLAALNKLALALAGMGAVNESLDVHQRMLVQATVGLGELDPATLTALQNVAAGLLKAGRAAEALPLAVRAMTLREEVLGPAHPETLRSMGEAAAVRSALGDFAGALALDEKALAGRRATLGERHPDTLAALNSVAEDLNSLGRYAEALPLHERAYALRRDVLGERSPDALASLNNLTATYEFLGRDDDALKLHEKAVALWTAAVGERHPSTLTSMSNHARALAHVGRAEEALAIQERILRVRSETLGPRHPSTIATHAALASSQFSVGRYDLAAPNAEKAYAAYLELLGPDHPDTVRAQDNLATAWLYLGRSAQALPLFEQALAKYTALLGELHPNTVGVMPNLAALYYGTGKRAEGLALYERMVQSVERIRASGDLSPENRQALFARWVAAYKQFVQVLLVERRFERAFEIAELSKARTLLESSAVRRANQSGVLDPEEALLVQVFESRIATLGDRIASSFDKPEQKLALETEKNKLVQQFSDFRRGLTRKYPKYASLTDVQILNAAAGKQLLAPDAVFVSYLTLGDRVVAFTLDATGKLDGFELGQVPDLARAVEGYRLLIADPQGSTGLAAAGIRIWRLAEGRYTLAPKAPAPGAAWVRDPDELARYLGARLIAPLRLQLGAKRHWILSPEGALTLLPFETLIDAGERAIEDHDISYAQSLSMLGLLRARERDYAALGARRTLFAMGGARYGAIAAAAPTGVEIMRGGSAVKQAFEKMDIRWDDLPGSEREVDSIAALFPPEQVTVLKGDLASERELAERNATRELAQFRYLLFSTHGYLSTVEPALSAVVLSQDQDDPDTDGYVTASEWTRYDLQSDLIVLSACETGVGRIVQGEGVTGLPFALYVAGNRNTLLSLWPVVDESTAEFMGELFRRLRAGESQVAALNAVKRGFLQDPRKRFVAPLYWAPFVLYGG